LSNSANSKANRKPESSHEALGLTSSELLDNYYTMVLARVLDERVWMLNRQGKASIASSSQGHEAAEIGAVWAVRTAQDYIVFPYYRSLATNLAAGLTTKEILLSLLAKEGEPLSGARQFLMQGASLKLKLINLSNVVGTQITQAVGYALGARMMGQPLVALTTFGDGGASQGEFHEALNFAGIHKLPVVFLCENNGYAISVPMNKQMAIESVAKRADSYGFPGVSVDGNNILEVYSAVREAVIRAEAGEGPTLVETKVTRYLPHTSEDDDTMYRSREEVEEAKKSDPLILFRDYLLSNGMLTLDANADLLKKAKNEVNTATDEGDAAPYPRGETLYDHVYGPTEAL
jgi:2-oxoisovalerate dehydrogenase E1 component alpha subunit